MLANARFTLPRSGLVVLLAALAAFAPMSIDMYLPALPSIARDLGVPASDVQATLAVFMAGFSAGMLLYGPVSDRFGRRPVMMTGIFIFIIASLACVYVERIDQLIVARLFQAIGGGAAFACRSSSTLRTSRRPLLRSSLLTRRVLRRRGTSRSQRRPTY